MSVRETKRDFRELYGYQEQKKLGWKERLAKLPLLPSKKTLFSFFPILEWLLHYDVKRWLICDFVSGLTIGVLQIPQGMAYAALAEVSPVYGLYTAFFPVLLYTVFGTSKHLSMGSYALTSLMVGAYLNSALPLPSHDVSHNSTNHSALVKEVYDERIGHANAITFFSALFLILFGIFHVGFITRIFARPFQSGFIFAITVLTILSQGKSVFGVDIGSYSGPLYMIWVIRDLFSSMISATGVERWRIVGSVVTSIVCITFLFIVKYLNEKFKKKYFRNIPIPGEAMVIVGGTLFSWVFNLEVSHHLDVVGPIAKGLPNPSFPHFHLFGSIALQSFLIAIVGYSVVVSLAQTLAERGGYTIKPNQELFAFGFSNLFGSMFSCIPSFTSMSRSCVQFESGGKTQLVGWVSSVLMLFVLLFVGPVFQYLPKACLASIVIVAVSGLLKNVYDVKRYWTNHKLDAVTWLCTCLATLLLDVTLGMITGIAVLLVCQLFSSSYVKPFKLAQIEGLQQYEREGLYSKEVAADDNVTLIKFNGPLNFFNSSILKKALATLSGINPAMQNSKANLGETKDIKPSVEKKTLQVQTILMEDRSSSDQDEAKPFKDAPSSQTIILECSGISSIDSVGVDLLTKVISDYKRVGIMFFLACCSDSVLKCLDSIEDVANICYVTVHGAVKAAETIKRESAQQRLKK